MKLAVVGGGPAGLYFALLLKKARPACDITVLERNRRDDAFGWGVVFSDQTLENFRGADEHSFDAMTASLAHWDDIDVHVRGRVITSSGHAFSGIARRCLLNILQERCEALGVTLRFQADLADTDTLERYGLANVDLLVAADGVRSALRTQYAGHLGPDLDVRSAKYIWLGTTLPLDAFTFYFVENEHGVFQAHCYRFDADTATFIVECDGESWRRAGFDRLDLDATVAACESLFAPWLGGHRLRANAPPTAPPWNSFVRVRNRSWYHVPSDREPAGRPVVLIGDAAHTAHFSIGSGTKLAMEDAVVLARVLACGAPMAGALAAYERERMTEALRLQNAARNSMEWFEHVKRYIRLEPEQFVYSLLTRSQRVSHENLRLRDSKYLSGVERWFASRADTAGDGAAPVPMFTPYSLRGMSLANRVVVAPMDMYSADDGTPGDFHLVHLGTRALGGAGLVISEMACVSADGRITPGCAGIYRPEHVLAWRRIVEFVHRHSAARICLQLGHAGPKGSVRLPWEGTDVPLGDQGWAVIGPSAIRYAPQLPVPREMTRADMNTVCAHFASGARMGIEAGFDMLELHCAHGYLLSSFITPLSNRRSDQYGGSLENRLRFPLEVFGAIRAVWPADRPMSVRISATDWVDGGVTGDEAVDIARAFAAAGVDIVHVSTGQTSMEARPIYGRMYQTPFSDQVRNEANIPTIAVGNITEPDQVNSIIASGRADLCALARPHLTDPFWTLHAAARAGHAGQSWPVQYLTGRRQLERELERQAATTTPATDQRRDATR